MLAINNFFIYHWIVLSYLQRMWFGKWWRIPKFRILQISAVSVMNVWEDVHHQKYFRCFVSNYEICWGYMKCCKSISGYCLPPISSSLQMYGILFLHPRKSTSSITEAHSPVWHLYKTWGRYMIWIFQFSCSPEMI